MTSSIQSPDPVAGSASVVQISAFLPTTTASEPAAGKATSPVTEIRLASTPFNTSTAGAAAYTSPSAMKYMFPASSFVTPSPIASGSSLTSSMTSVQPASSPVWSDPHPKSTPGLTPAFLLPPFASAPTDRPTELPVSIALSVNNNISVSNNHESLSRADTGIGAGHGQSEIVFSAPKALDRGRAKTGRVRTTRQTTIDHDANILDLVTKRSTQDPDSMLDIELRRRYYRIWEASNYT
jgi:hypothetical protein